MLTFCRVGAMVRIKFILLVGQPKSSIAIKHFFREVGEELLEYSATINTHPAQKNPVSLYTQLRHIYSLIFAELIYERYLNGVL